MSNLFPHNSDPSILKQSDAEYRIAKYPCHVRHRYIDSKTKEEKYWDSSHCPVCFWNQSVGLWDSLIDRDSAFCRRCGQKVKWE